MTATDALGVVVLVGDVVRVTSWGGRVRLIDVGGLATVTGFTPRGGLVHDSDDIANGQPLRPASVSVCRRDGLSGHEGNRGTRYDSHAVDGPRHAV